MLSHNPKTRRRQRRRRKERAKANKRKNLQRYYDDLSLMHSPYQEDQFMRKSCARKNRYSTEIKAIHACIVRSAKSGMPLSWYKCGRCNGWHITSHPIEVH